MPHCGCLSLDCSDCYSYVAKPDYVGDVKEFHETYGVPIGTTKFDDDERLHMRMRLHDEEYGELFAAFDDYDAVEYLDALVDLVYVVVGTAVELGYDFNEAWRRVHASNMSKLDENGKPIYREDGKILKGPNFKPPKLDDLV